MMTIVADEVGSHDTIGGACSQESNTLRYGHHTKHQHACVENFLARGRAVGPDQARHRLQRQLLHERAGRPRRHARHRRRPVRAGQASRAARRDRHAGAGEQLPADQQPLQRIRPDAGADDRDPAGGSEMSAIEVVRPGMSTTVQDWPGRVGYWQVGVPPSGPMDDLSFRLANVAVGNPEGAPGLEAVMTGPALRFAAGHLGMRRRSAGAGHRDGRVAPAVAAGAGAGGRGARRRRGVRARSADRDRGRGRACRTTVSGQRVDLHHGPIRRTRGPGAGGGRRAAVAGAATGTAAADPHRRSNPRSRGAGTSR